MMMPFLDKYREEQREAVLNLLDPTEREAFANWEDGESYLTNIRPIVIVQFFRKFQDKAFTKILIRKNQRN